MVGHWTEEDRKKERTGILPQSTNRILVTDVTNE